MLPCPRTALGDGSKRSSVSIISERSSCSWGAILSLLVYLEATTCFGFQAAYYLRLQNHLKWCNFDQVPECWRFS